MGTDVIERRYLGRTGLEVSALGFGGGGIGHEYGATSEVESLAAIDTALEAGINFFDVAPSYGHGRAERVLGLGLGQRRGDVIIMTKVDLLPGGRDHIDRFVRDSVYASLERLRTDYIDVLLVHNAVTTRRGRPYEWCIEVSDAFAMVDEFDKLQRDGVVRFLGFSGWRCTEDALDALFRSGRFDVVQSEYNLLNTSAIRIPPRGSDLGVMSELERLEDPVAIAAYDFRGTDQHRSFSRARALGLGSVAIRPLMGGALALKPDREMHAGSDLERMYMRASGLRTMLSDLYGDTSIAALRYCLMASEIDTIIPGFKNSEEVLDALKAFRVPDLDLTQLREAMPQVSY